MRQSAPRAWPGEELGMRISGICDIAERFDSMLIDQFGVIHDSQKLYPGTLRVLSELKSLKIPVVIMTNSGKRAAANRDRLVRIGVARDLFVDCVSSGEVAFDNLQGKRAFLVGKKGEDYGFEGVTFVDNPRDAELILILGSDAPQTSLEDYRKLFSTLSLPAVCCNPDKLMLTPNGLQPAPGAIAALYEEMGGKVTWIGKPYPEVYRHAASLAGNPKHILCVGDSAEHDVAGGRNAGMATLLVLTGVSEGLDPGDLQPQPDFIISNFTW
jgi:HAD superfamily hydrolase (TIGR01459 family)